MRRIWWLVLGVSALALAGIAVAVALIVTRDGDDTRTVAGECRPAERSGPAGNADITERVTGRGFDRTIVIRAEDKESGAPLRDAKVTVRAEMSCPHFMPLYQERLRETSSGTYRGPYRLIMPGQWAISIVVRSKEGEATTSALPLNVKTRK